MTEDALLARFAVEHFDRNSIGEHRRAAPLRVVRRVAAQVAPRTLTEITPSDVMSWQAAELGRDVKPNSVRNFESMLHAFVRWMELAQLIDFQRAVQVRSVSPVRGAHARLRPRPYKRTEIHLLRQLIDECYPLPPTKGEGMYAIRNFLAGRTPLKTRVKLYARRLQLEAQVSLALEEGLRKTEIFNLSIPHLHPDNESVVVRTLKSKPGELREREVPYGDHSRLCVREWLEFRQHIVRGAHERPWLRLLPSDPASAQSAKALEGALEVFDGLSQTDVRFRWHRLRHTFATEMLRAGLPLEKLQLMMGHANLQQTLAYAEIVNTDLVTEAARTADQFALNLGLAA